MRRKMAVILCTAALTAALVTGCGGSGEETKGSSAAEETVETAAEEMQAETAEETAGAESTEEASEDEKADAAGTELAGGVYSAEFDTDSGMFHVSEANEGRGVLTVENGKMTIHVSLASKNIVNLFAGTAEDAQKDGAEILQPTTDTVTYSDGISEEVYGFDIPVPVLDEEFDLALVGTKGKWYDHKVSVSNPQPQE